MSTRDMNGLVGKNDDATSTRDMNGHKRIAWTALEPGTPVHGSDGSDLGKVGRVVGDEANDIFSGITIRSGLLAHERFAPADLVSEITPAAVHLLASSEEAERLESFEER